MALANNAFFLGARKYMAGGNPIVTDVIASDLARYGARRCFALLGIANFKISHALAQAGVELISARHECNARSMADAYAKASGELTLVSVHSGPGLTNALTGIAESAKSRTPLVVLAGDAPNGAVKNNFYRASRDGARGRRHAGAAAYARQRPRRHAPRRHPRAA
jgi:thiamine pyrophosphate-dependent acetolactate synthase large subunit-like protein